MARGNRHVVLVVLDTARADVFEPYGAPAGATPSLARLAADGWSAPRAVAPSSWTLPSHVGLLLGLPHHEAGLDKRTQERPQSARPVLDANRSRYLPHVLREHGYRTSGASANPWLQEISGFADGFDEFVPLWQIRRSRIAPQRVGPVREAVVAALGHADHGLRDAAAFADRWIDDTARDGRPSFLFLNLMECHSPYMPPRPFNPLGPLSRIRAAREAKQYLNMLSVWRANLARQLPPDDVMTRMRALYLQSVRYMDHWVGVFVRKLQRARLYDETLIVVTSDHGENLGEGARIGHSFSIDQRLIHVPLIVANASARVPKPVVSLTQVPALVAHETGLDSIPWGEGFAGREVVISRVEGVGTPEDPHVIDFLREADLEHAAELMTSDTVCALDGRYKLIRRGGMQALYDLDSDPLEEDEISEEQLDLEAAQRVDRLRTEIDRSNGAAVRAPSATVAPTTGSDDETRRLEEQLKMLGYM